MSSAAKKKKILVVDNNSDALEILRRLLEQNGYYVYTAINGESAVKRAVQVKPDLILLDVLMPGMDGFETCRQMKLNDKSKDIPVVFMTGLSTTENKLSGFEAGGIDYITKPFDQQEILARIKIHLSLREMKKQLEKKNKQLEKEIGQRKRVEDELRLLNSELEQRVEERTAELEKANTQLIQSQKLESIGTLAGGIAHDFNNLLTVINGHADISRMKLEKEHPVYRDVMSIKQAGERAANLTRQLLAFSRKQAFSPKILDINNMINGLEKTVFRLIGEDIEIKKTLQPDIGHILADPGQIEQIIINLIVNARDAVNARTDISAEKKICIETSSIFLDQDFAAENVGSSVGRHILISIADNGIGMDRELVNKIFEPFFTTKETDKGTGLGLATVYGIVKQNNGSIFVDSRPGNGTTFKIYWPLSEETLHTEPDDMRAGGMKLGSETILLVEDNEEVKKIASASLRSLGYKVYETSNGQEAYNLLQEKKLKLDLLLTDLIMPKMGGRELSEKLKKNYPDVKILFTSGYSDNQIGIDGRLMEGAEFLQKPYSLPILADKVREVLNK